MRTLKIVVAFVFTILLMSSCNSKPKQVTNQEDYNKYLEIKDNQPVDLAKNEIDFWQKK